jgi:hypothetical protein
MADWESAVWGLLELSLFYYETAIHMIWAMGFIVSVLSKNYT